VTGDAFADVVTVNPASNDGSVLVSEGGGTFQTESLRIHSGQDLQQLTATGLHAALLYDLALAVRFSDRVTLVRATSALDGANDNGPDVRHLPKIIQRLASMWELDVNGNLYFTGIDGLGYHYRGTTLTILDPLSSASEPLSIENVRKILLSDSEGREIDPYDQ
jgi:hypothetical protein